MENQEEILTLLNNLPKTFIAVIGKSILENTTVIESLIIPNIGERIHFDKKQYQVIDKTISYQQIYKHELNSDERGKEMIYVFLKEIF